MMLLPNEGITFLLDNMLHNPLTTNEDLHLDLYNNNYTPVPGSTFSDFTVASFTGYAQVTLTRSGWGSSALVGNKAVATYTTNPITWTVTGTSTDTIYGYLVRGATSGKVYFAELISPARPMQTIGDTLNLTLPFELETEP